MNSMNQSKNQGEWYGKGRCFFTVVHSLFIIPLLLIGCNVYAAQTCIGVSASTPTSDFIVNTGTQAGTVTHKKTGLMWKQCSEGLSGANCATGTAATTFTWPNALARAQTVNNGGGFAGFTDWRVPNKKELASIVEVQCASPSINATIFPATVAANYWSASPYVGAGYKAWSVVFLNGNDFNPNTANSANLRLVRGGQ